MRQAEDKTPQSNNDLIWLKATYYFHVFHYRMPETAAIAAVTPFVPSPLTIKMAMVASLFQIGDIEGVKKLANHLHKIEVKIIPPKSALSFKVFMRYRSPPAVKSEEKSLDETGSYYPSRPHIREYSIFQGNLEVYVKIHKNLTSHIKKALKNIRYLGSKDSLSTCSTISEVNNPPKEECFINKLANGIPGVVVLLADFKPNIQIQNIEKFIKELIPGNRDPNIYEVAPYTIPAEIKTKGKSRVLFRH